MKKISILYPNRPAGAEFSSSPQLKTPAPLVPADSYRNQTGTFIGTSPDVRQLRYKGFTFGKVVQGDQFGMHLLAGKLLSTS